MSVFPLTQKQLIDWGGASVFRDAQSLVERGFVRDADYQDPIVTGQIIWGNRALKTSVRVLSDGTAENLCPCRDNKERGIICSHVIALCLDLVHRRHSPEREAQRQAEQRRAARLAQYTEQDYLRRVPPETPGAIPARLELVLGERWREACPSGPFGVALQLVMEGRTVPMDQVPRALPLTFSKADESLLYVLEDMAGGPPAADLTLSPADLINLLDLCTGRHLAQRGSTAAVVVHDTRLPSFLQLELDRENGELILMVETELPFRRPGEFPRYIVAGKYGWVLSADHLWPIQPVLPEPLHSIYREPTVVPRNSVPSFVRNEWPLLNQFIRIQTDLTPDLFAVDPAVPEFRLAMRGSPASLAAVLFAVYGDIALVAGKTDPHGAFAIPDPRDLMRYTVRNPAAEAEALARLASVGYQGDCGDTLRPVVGTREVLNFLGSQLPALRRAGWKVELEGSVSGYFEGLDFATPVVHVNTPESANWFDIGFTYEDRQGSRLSDAEIQRALRKGESFIERDGRTILIDSAAVQSLIDVFHDCASTEGAEAGSFRMTDIYAAYVKASLDPLDGVDVEAAPAWRFKAERHNRILPLEPVPIPAALDAILRPYQKEGVAWLRFLERNQFGGILADEMGLGKTLQTLTWMTLERAHEPARGRPALIVCPTSLVENWAEEAHRFVPHLRVLTVSGADRHSRWDQLDQADLVVTSYALMRRDVEHYAGREFSILVLDEAQHIKNRSTQNAIAAKQLKAHHRLVLTGTPIENSVADLWSIMDFLMPGYLGRHDNFRQAYELPIAAAGPEGQVAQTRLRRKLQPFLLRRLKSEVARDLPPKIARVANCSLSADQKVVYRQLVESSRRRLTDLVARQGFQRSRMEVLRTLLRLRQACCHLDLLKLPGLQAQNPSAKLELFFELLDEALDAQHRILVFSQFVSMLTIIRKAFDARGLSYCYLDGATQDRLAVVREFNTNRKIPVFLISLKAGGTGLNLTGADMVIHFDPWWNPAVEDQATDRAYRIGQKRTVYSVKLITRGTVEEKVLALQQRKKEVIDSTLAATSEGTLAQLNWNDVQDLLTV